MESYLIDRYPEAGKTSDDRRQHDSDSHEDKSSHRPEFPYVPQSSRHHRCAHIPQYLCSQPASGTKTGSVHDQTHISWEKSCRDSGKLSQKQRFAKQPVRTHHRRLCFPQSGCRPACGHTPGIRFTASPASGAGKAGPERTENSSFLRRNLTISPCLLWLEHKRRPV